MWRSQLFSIKRNIGNQVTKDKDDYERYYEDIVKMGNGMENPELIKTYISNIKNSLYLLNKIGFEPWLRKDLDLHVLQNIQEISIS